MQTGENDQQLRRECGREQQLLVKASDAVAHAGVCVAFVELNSTPWRTRGGRVQFGSTQMNVTALIRQYIYFLPFTRPYPDRCVFARSLLYKAYSCLLVFFFFRTHLHSLLRDTTAKSSVSSSIARQTPGEKKRPLRLWTTRNAQNTK